MCGRFALAAPKAQLVLHFELDEFVSEGEDFPARYNIPPGTDIAVIRQSPEGKRVLQHLRWGLIPHWSKDPSLGAKLNNARGESVHERPAFKSAFAKRRCLVPVSGFYEWKAEGKTKQPYYFSSKSGVPLALAGLWESWRAPDGTIIRTVCIITSAANELMASVHDRMPVIIETADWARWLDAPPEAVADLLRPYAGTDLQAWPVDRRVSRPAEDDERLLAALSLAPVAAYEGLFALHDVGE